MIKIKDIADIQTGVYLKPSPDANTIYLQVNDYDNERNNISTMLPSVETTLKSKHHLLLQGDILFACKGTNNFSVLFTGSKDKCVASSSFLVIRLKNNSKIIPEYLNWYLNLPSTLTALRKEAVGTSMPSITKSTVEELEIPIPAIEKQTIIVEIERLQRDEAKIFAKLAEKRKLLIDNKLKNIIR